MSRLAPLSAAVAAATLLAVAAGGGPATAKPIDQRHHPRGVQLRRHRLLRRRRPRHRDRGRRRPPFPHWGHGAPPSCPTSSSRSRSTRPSRTRTTTEFVTYSSRSIGKDLKVTDNGDGTFTILVLATGNETCTGWTGRPSPQPGPEPLGDPHRQQRHSAGPHRRRVPEFLGDVKGSTGRTDDACAAIVRPSPESARALAR